MDILSFVTFIGKKNAPVSAIHSHNLQLQSKIETTGAPLLNIASNQSSEISIDCFTTPFIIEIFSLVCMN
jgi:hypothetical protein